MPLRYQVLLMWHRDPCCIPKDLLYLLWMDIMSLQTCVMLMHSYQSDRKNRNRSSRWSGRPKRPFCKRTREYPVEKVVCCETGRFFSFWTEENQTLSQTAKRRWEAQPTEENQTPKNALAGVRNPFMSFPSMKVECDSI